MTGLKAAMSGQGEPDWKGPYRDVRAAWLWYLAHENHGRGVVLIGHSQGAILLRQLVAREIEGKPAQKLLVSAILAGDPELETARGGRTGGSFKSIPICASAGETGCVYAWNTYLADDMHRRIFGRDEGPGLQAACVNPASPAGGAGDLDGYLRRPAMAPADDPPWVRLEHQLSAACVRADGDVALVVTIKPSRYADLLKAGLPRYELAPGWGLHRLDLSLPMHNVIDIVAAESRTWAAR
jgi:hypothetical protein